MADHKITDFVDQSAIDGLRRLKDEMQSVKETYIQTASELARGLRVSVDGLDQLDRMTRQVAELQRQAAEATQRHTSAVNEQGQILGRTTAVIAESLQSQNRLNREVRQSKVDFQSVMEAVEKVNGTYEQQLHRLIQVEDEIKRNKKVISDYQKAIAEGRDTTGELTGRLIRLTAANRELAQGKSKLNSLLKAEEKESIATAGSYDEMSQQLEILKKQYKGLGEEQREAAEGKELLETINQLDTELKHMAENMGEHQRNVGNYAIAVHDGVVSIESLNTVMSQQALTQQDLIDQTKILEEAKTMLNREDANYQSTLDALNAKIEENKKRLMDVSDIMGKEATTVAEAEAQNKRLAEAMKHIDLTSSDAKKKLEEMRAQIERNNQTIGEATGANEKFADSMLGLIGVNTNFGSSLQSLNTGDNFLDGLKTKVEAFGKTLLGLLANPWVLTFLGLSGVVAGFKWWYDYNKGLIEASRLTENFTGATGNAADKVTADMQTLADKMEKGYDATIGAANTLVQQFGISWDDAYNKMKNGISAGADMSGNMIANIDRFAPALRDAGVSADEFMAILAETRNGIFNEAGIQNIVKAGTRLRSMTKQTEESLDAVGISAKQMQKDLEDGNISMLDAVKQVAGKLKELPENSQEAGQIMKNVFGRTAAEGGTLLIQSIADINTNLDKAKENMGELGRVNEEQMNAQRELNELLMSVFKASGTSFETMTIQAKTFVAQGLTVIIKGCVDIVNWLIRMYNNSMLFRGACNAISNSFKIIWEIAKFAFNQIIDSFKSAGEMIEGIFTLDWDKVKAGWENGVKAFSGNIESLYSNLAKNAADAWNNTLNDQMQEVSANFDDNLDNNNILKEDNADGDNPDINGGPKNTTDKDAETRAKEELKLIQELEYAKIEAMAEGHEKDLALIRQKYKRKLDEIKGTGDTERALRIQLATQCEKEIANCEMKYQTELAKINLANRLASVKEGSKEELDLKLAQLEAGRAVEIEAAEKTGADVSLINAKFDKQRAEMLEDYAHKQIEKAQQTYASEAAIADNAYNQQINKLNAKYAEELKAAGNNMALREAITEKHEKEVAKLTEAYAQQRAQASVESLEQLLNTENLSADERLQLEDQLAKAKIEAEKAVTDAVIAENQRQVDADNEAFQKRMENVQKWLQVASDGLNAINDLASTIFDAKIERIEAEQEANTEAGEAEQERITELVEKNVITEEEGEARKRAAEERTAKKNEELEKKKQQLKYKQAVWDKANQLAQAGINTAMSITQTAAQLGIPAAIPFIAIAGAMGAIQIATILATPIPKYAKGTKDHPGGLAIVGDGGRQEIVSYGGNMFLTPDTPTLIDMPKGAEVFPDADKLLASNADLAGAMRHIGDSPKVVVNNDYTDLKREVVALGNLIKMQTKMQRRSASQINYEQFKIGQQL